MKRNAVARIVIFSIVIVILLGILFTGLGIGMFMVNLDFSDSDYTTAQTATVLFPLDEVKNIDIEWASGEITIQPGDVDAIHVTESGSNDVQPMSYRQSGDTLYIRYSDVSFKLGFFSTASKDLTVTVPRNWVCEEISMEVASADVTVTELNARQFHVDTASGDYDFISCAIEDLDIDTASGSIEYEGTLNTLDCDAASGRFVGVFTNTPSVIDMNSASGDLDITLPADTGFRVSMDALSGSFNSDFPASVTNGQSYVYGDGACEITFDGASGGIRIRKGA